MRNIISKSLVVIVMATVAAPVFAAVVPGSKAWGFVGEARQGSQCFYVLVQMLRHETDRQAVTRARVTALGQVLPNLDTSVEFGDPNYGYVVRGISNLPAGSRSRAVVLASQVGRGKNGILFSLDEMALWSRRLRGLLLFDFVLSRTKPKPQSDLDVRMWNGFVVPLMDEADTSRLANHFDDAYARATSLSMTTIDYIRSLLKQAKAPELRSSAH